LAEKKFKVQVFLVTHMATIEMIGEETDDETAVTLGAINLVKTGQVKLEPIKAGVAHIAMVQKSMPGPTTIKARRPSSRDDN